MAPDQLQSLVIPRLALPEHEVLVASEESNEKIALRTKGAQISAFARIAGPTWTVYMREERLVIGRAPDIVRSSDANGNLTNASANPDDQVQIDLGPNKIVSRAHAVIEFGTSWQISVTGRNGAKVDDARVERGRSAPLHAGSVIEVGGCQMMFLLPDDTGFTIARPILEDLGLIESDQGAAPDQPSSDARTRRDSRPADDSLPSELADFDSRASILSGSTVMNRPVTPPPAPSSATIQLRRPAHPSPAGGARDLALETMEAIDYSLDSMKDFKPPHSYAMLIGLAILSAEDHQLSLAAVYQWIKDRFAYFRHAHPGWQVLV